MKSNWNGLVKILEVEHLSKEGDVLWKSENLYNILHTTGEQYILEVVFDGTTIPTTYFFGLDNRVSLEASDTMLTIATEGNEPTINGYIRQGVLSAGEFVVALNSGIFQASSPIVSFRALDGPWGPVKNLFFTTQADNSGFLVASVPLGEEIIVADGQIVNFRMGLALRDCPDPCDI